MLVCRSYISIVRSGVEVYSFENVAECNIKMSYELLTGTCDIKFQNKFTALNKTVLAELQRGDGIVVALGYGNTNTTRFDGYITSVDPNSPVTLQCSDAMWKLKQYSVEKYTGSNLTLKKLMTAVFLEAGITTIPFNVIDTHIGSFVIENVSVAEIISYICKKYKLKAWFRNGQLYIGTPLTISTIFTGQDEYNFYFDGSNANIISDSLEYIDADDWDIVVKGVSIKPDNTKITRYAKYQKIDGADTVQIYSTQPEGNLRTFHYYNYTAAQLEDKIEAILPQIHYTGYRGGITSFGDAIATDVGGAVFHGDDVNLYSEKQPERNGKYQVKTVGVQFGTNGYRQILELGRKVL